MPPAFTGTFLCAHRGYCEEHPENSLGAFKAAEARGCTIELDVRFTRDVYPVVIHDQDLRRLTGVAARVEELRWDELEHLRLLQDDKGSDEGIPLLADVLDATSCGVIIEIKEFGLTDRGLEDAVIDVLHKRRDTYDRVIAHSFNPFALARVAKRDPRLYRSQVFGFPQRFKRYARYVRPIVRGIIPTSISKPDAVAGEICLFTKSVVRRYKETDGIAVFGWTAGSDADLAHARSLGLDIIITDYLPPETVDSSRR